MKSAKGEYGHISSMKLISCLTSAGFFLVALVIYLAGAYVFPDQKIMVRIVSMLICIPAAMAVVRFILFMQVKQGDSSVRDLTEEARGSVPVFYDALLTTYEKNYYVNVFAAADNELAGYTATGGKDIPAIEKHLREIYGQNDKGNVHIKIFSDMNAFTGRLRNLAESYSGDTDADLAVLHLIERISL
jgi:hypothetical protein